MPLTRSDWRQIGALINRLVDRLHSDPIVKAINHQTNAIEQQTKTYQKASEPKPTGDPQRISAHVDFTPEERQRGDAEQKTSHRLQRANLWVSIVTLIVLGIYTNYTRRQWEALLESNRITKISAEAAKSAAETAQAALADSQQSFAIQNRPYVMFSSSPWSGSITNDAIFPGSVKSSIRYTNIGKSVAKDILCHRILRLVPLPDPLADNTVQEKYINSIATITFREALKLPSGRTTLAPSDSMITDTRPITVSGAEALSVMHREAILLLTGVIKYRDSFQNSGEAPHETEFCMWTFGNTLARANKCGVHNDIR